MDLAAAIDLLKGAAIYSVGVGVFVAVCVPLLGLAAHWALDKRHGVER